MEVLSVPLDGRTPRDGEYRTDGRSDGSVSPAVTWCLAASTRNLFSIHWPYGCLSSLAQRFTTAFDFTDAGTSPKFLTGVSVSGITTPRHRTTAPIVFLSTGHLDWFEFAQRLMGFRSTNRWNHRSRTYRWNGPCTGFSLADQVVFPDGRDWVAWRVWPLR